MRYTTKREQHRALYRTLPEWVAIVQAAAGGDVDDAKQQILGGLKDKQFAECWEEMDTEQAGDHRSWHTATVASDWINWVGGTIFCDQNLTAESRAAGCERWLTLLLTPKIGSVFAKMFAERDQTNGKKAPSAGAPNDQVTSLGQFSKDLVEAVKVCAARSRPPEQIDWRNFCHAVRQQANKAEEARGWGDRTIQNRYRAAYPKEI